MGIETETKYDADADTALPDLHSLPEVRGTSGLEVQKRSSRTFLHDLESPRHEDPGRSQLQDRVDEETRKRLEKLRRGQRSG